MLISFIQSAIYFHNLEIDRFQYTPLTHIKHMYYDKTARFTIKSEVYTLHTFFKKIYKRTLLWEFLFILLVFIE